MQSQAASPVNRWLVLLYGIVAYLIGVAGLATIIVAMGKLIPFGFLQRPGFAESAPVLWNGLLMAIWGVSHTAMARSGFKRWLTQIIPEPAERSTYVLVAGIVSFLLVGLWQPIDGTLWSVQSQLLSMVIWGLFLFGWAYLLAASFAIDHFDLFGLRQVYLYFKNQPREPLKFVKRAMYSFSRHPIQTGVLIGSWAIPTMTMTHFAMSLGFTIYILIGLWFEERDLVSEIGEPYLEYRKQAGKFLPKLVK